MLGTDINTDDNSDQVNSKHLIKELNTMPIEDNKIIESIPFAQLMTVTRPKPGYEKH